MKKRILTLAAVACALLMLTGCGFSMFADYLDGLSDSSVSEPASEPESHPEPEAPESEAETDSSLPDFDFDSLFGDEGGNAGGDAPQEPAGEAGNAPEADSIVGYFAQVDDQLSPQYYPSIQLNADGSFTMMANLYEGMGTITGSWAREGSSLTLSVSDRDFWGFAGDDVSTMTLSIVDDNTLHYTGAVVGYTQSGAYFYRS